MSQFFRRLSVSWLAAVTLFVLGSYSYGSDTPSLASQENQGTVRVLYFKSRGFTVRFDEFHRRCEWNGGNYMVCRIAGSVLTEEGPETRCYDYEVRSNSCSGNKGHSETIENFFGRGCQFDGMEIADVYAEESTGSCYLK